MTAAHTLTVHFDAGDTERVTIECHLAGPDRPCAVITCPVDHEDVTRSCVELHGATALDMCWAVDWVEQGGRDSLTTQALPPITVPIEIDYDTGVVVRSPRESDAAVCDWCGLRVVRAEHGWCHRDTGLYGCESRPACYAQVEGRPQ